MQINCIVIINDAATVVTKQKDDSSIPGADLPLSRFVQVQITYKFNDYFL